MTKYGHLYKIDDRFTSEWCLKIKDCEDGKFYLEFLLVEVTDDQDEHRFTVILELGTDFVIEQWIEGEILRNTKYTLF